MKLHLGAGTVYLTGYVNVDIQGPKTFLAKDRPDLVNKYATTDDNYYGRHQDKTQDKLRAGPLDQEYVCDAYGDFLHLPSPAWEATEVLARNVLEHLSITEAHKALDQCDEVLKPGGILRIDVPDHEQTLELYRQTGDAFYKRHLFGPRRNEFGYHLVGYSREYLKNLVEHHGFVFQADEPNVHFYPSISMRFVKPGPRAPYQYLDMPEIKNNWRVLEIGPGNYPLPQATSYIDIDKLTLDRVFANSGKECMLGDITKGLPGVSAKNYDWAFCSHVLEHTQDINAAVHTLNRIAKRGMIVMPSVYKEAIGWFEETEHLWDISSSAETGEPIFVRRNQRVLKRLANSELQTLACHQFRIGPNRRSDAGERYSRQWYFRNEKYLDVVAMWDDEHPLKIRVIE